MPYTPDEMYTLVDEIELYPEFLPWCRSTLVHHRDEDEVQATIEFARGAIHKSFTTRNRLQRGKMIEMRLMEGPFRHLEGFWRFDALGAQGCKVSLDLEFEFAGRLLSLTVSPVFSQIANSLVDAFCERAVETLGRR